MKNHNVLLLLLLLLGLWNCQSNEEESFLTLAVPGECTNCINFEDMKVGQQNRYAGFTGKRDFADQDWQYNGDTLVVKVTGTAGEDFVFEEYRTSDPDSIRTYTVSVADDSVNVLLTEYWIGSWLFSGGLNIPFALPPANFQTVQIKGWEAVVRCETSPCYGYLTEHRQRQSIYTDLFVYHNYGPMAWDGNGYFAIYNRKYGVIRSASVGSWFPVASGWDLIVE